MNHGGTSIPSGKVSQPLIGWSVSAYKNLKSKECALQAKHVLRATIRIEWFNVDLPVPVSLTNSSQAKGWDVIGGGEGYQLREESARYNVLFRAKNSAIDAENALLWDVHRNYSNG